MGATENLAIGEDLAPRPLAEQAVRVLAEQAAQAAAQRTADLMAPRIIESVMIHLGIDSTDPSQMKRLREDLQFLTRASRGAREVKSVVVKTCVGAVVTGAIAILVIGFKDWILAALKVH